jgi:peptidoglycan/xylan/chitin deacetylase (PgdA/CDA1 family)
MADRLFELGNHGWTHGNFHMLKGEALDHQILWTQAEYANLREELNQQAFDKGMGAAMASVPEQLLTLRFPYGTCSSEALDRVNQFGLAAVQWNVVSGDPGRIAPTPRLLKAIQPGSIVVFHANGRGHGTAAALPKIIEGLLARGFEFKTVSELLAAGEVKTVKECYELKPGDNLRYDALFGEGTESHEKGAGSVSRAKTVPAGGLRR